ncbi:hypothetical protein LIT32_23640 [Bacillus sp. CMF21]|nr:hypothetical protein LIT32_23640 [Bacillus sp. CMF21]
MILVTLGTQKFPMNRVIDEIDRLIEVGLVKREEIVIQNGYSKVSKYALCYKMISESKFESLLHATDLVICHGGTSSIVKSLKTNKKVIAIPRKSQFKEHVDNHQAEIVEVFYQKGYLEKVENIDELGKVISEIKNKNFNKYHSSGELANFIVDMIIN